MLSDFKAFLLKENIFSLAIAVLVGTALNAVVKSLVDNLIMPIIAVAMPSGDWQKATWTVGAVKFGVGDFLAALINFLIIGFVAWRLSKMFIKPAAENTVSCRYCQMKIDRAATRCPHCTSELAAAA